LKVAFYAGVLTGRFTGLARPSVRLSIHLSIRLSGTGSFANLSLLT